MSWDPETDPPACERWQSRARKGPLQCVTGVAQPASLDAFALPAPVLRSVQASLVELTCGHLYPPDEAKRFAREMRLKPNMPRSVASTPVHTPLPRNRSPVEAPSARQVSSRLPKWLALALLLTGSLILRLYGLEGGIPHFSPDVLAHTLARSSYYADEGAYLFGLTHLRPETGNLDVGAYYWGTLQFYFVYGALGLGTLIGFIPTPWDSGFLHGDLQAVERIYLLGRLVSVAFGVGGTLVVFALGRSLGGARAGYAAGVAYAIAPLAVIEAHYLTSDITMSVMAATVVLAAVQAVRSSRPSWLIGTGLLLGLATAAKYPALSVAPALLVAQINAWRGYRRCVGAAIRRQPRSDDELTTRRRWRRLAVIIALPWLAVCLGFLLGEPQMLLAPQQVMSGIREAQQMNVAAGVGPIDQIEILGEQLYYLASLGMGWPLALVALAGLACLVRRGSGRMSTRQEAEATVSARSDVRAVVVLIAIEGALIGVLLNKNLMIRYTQPLIPLLAAAAGTAWAAVPRARIRALIAVPVVAGAGIITLSQLALLGGPHPVNDLQAWLETRLRPGAQVAEMWPEYPALDGSRYRLSEIVPWKPDLLPDAHPDYILMNNMNWGAPTERLAARLAQDYVIVARFGAVPHLGPLEWDEGPTPHDWKYNHPTLLVYARR
jgi:hypothetical protein